MLKLTRKRDWDRRLARVIERHRATPGVWGESDCMLTAMDAVEAVTGVDPAAKLRGAYSTEIGAAKALRRRKAANVEEALAQKFPPIGRLLARRGDLATVERQGVIAAGVVTEDGVAVKTERGLTFVPQTEIRRAFRVG